MRKVQTILRLRLLPSSCAAFLLLLTVTAPCAWSRSPYSITVEWTAPADDPGSGRAYRYDLRYSTSYVGADTVGWWEGAETAKSLPMPSAPGQSDSVAVTGLDPETTYYFILRSFDEFNAASGFSNVASATTPPEIPAAQPGCAAPASAPAQFQAREDSKTVLLSWAPSSDPLATTLRVWRASGASGPLGLLGTVTDPAQTEYRDTGVRRGETYRYRATWSDSCGDGPATASNVISIPSDDPRPPATASREAAPLHAYPNPSRDAVRFVIHVEAPTGEQVHIRLFDLTGRVVAEIADGSFPSGDTTISWPRLTLWGDRVAPGYYESIGSVGRARVRERLILLP